MPSVSLHMYLSIYTVLYYRPNRPNRIGVFQSAFKTGMA